MSKLPQVSGKECIKALGKAGFYIKRQKGSHIILCRDEHDCRSGNSKS